MGNLERILQRHDGRDYFNAKVLQHAGRFASKQSAYNLMSGGSQVYEKLREMFRRLCKAGAVPVVHDVLNDLVEETPFGIRPRCDASGEAPVKLSIDAGCVWGEFTKELLAALKDNRVTDAEKSKLGMLLDEMDRTTAKVRAELERRTNLKIA